MTSRHLRRALAGSVLSFGLVALVPTTGWAQNTSLPDEGGSITLVGCFTRGTIGHSSKERFVLARPIVGSVASVREATCAANGGDLLIKLEDLDDTNLGEAQLGRWVEVQGRLEEKRHFDDGHRDMKVNTFALVPVVVPAPPVARVIPEPAPIAPEPAVEAPPAPEVAEVVITPAPVATAGVRKALPKTATSLPLFGLVGLVSLAAALAVRLTRRSIDVV